MNRVGLITGASRGLGAELAGFLAKRGYDMVLTARGSEELAATARPLEKYGSRIVAIAGDANKVTATMASRHNPHTPIFRELLMSHLLG